MKYYVNLWRSWHSVRAVWRDQSVQRRTCSGVHRLALCLCGTLQSAGSTSVNKSSLLQSVQTNLSLSIIGDLYSSFEGQCAVKKNKTFYHMWNDSSKGSKGNDGGVKPGNKSQSFHADMSYKNSHMAYSTITISEFLTLVSKLKLSANIDQQIMLKLVCDLMYMIFNRWMIQNC